LVRGSKLRDAGRLREFGTGLDEACRFMGTDVLQPVKHLAADNQIGRSAVQGTPAL
jgi:hypothetical protein